MLRDEAVEELRNAYQIDTDADPFLQASLRSAQTHIENGPRLPWFLGSLLSLTTTIDSNTVTLTDTFLQEVEEGALQYLPASGGEPVVLPKDNYDTLSKDLYGSGPPEAYTFVGDALYVFPTPDAAYTLRLPAKVKAAVLNTNIQNKWLQHAPWWLIGVAGSLFQPRYRDAEAQQFFSAVGTSAADNAMERTYQMVIANRTIIMGGET